LKGGREAWRNLRREIDVSCPTLEKKPEERGKGLVQREELGRSPGRCTWTRRGLAAPNRSVKKKRKKKNLRTPPDFLKAGGKKDRK